MLAINALIEYWKRQKIEIVPNSLEKIEEVLTVKRLTLPNDFIEYFRQVNGMGKLYYDPDWEGFSFHPITQLETLKEMKEDFAGELNDIVVFASYMHESWWYGVRIFDDSNYAIGLIADRYSFEIITTSLADFISLYLANDPALYV